MSSNYQNTYNAKMAELHPDNPHASQNSDTTAAGVIELVGSAVSTTYELDQQVEQMLKAMILRDGARQTVENLIYAYRLAEAIDTAK